MDPNSNDAGTGGTGSGSGTELASTCTATFTACGGDITGTWSLQSICAESNLVAAVNALYASGIDCGNVCASASMTASGSVMYSAQTVSSNESFRLVESLGFGDACFTELKGTTLSDSTCQTGANDFGGTASCALSLSTCACQVDQTTTDGASTYTLSGNNVTEYNSTTLTQETIEYCVTGSSMVQRRSLSPGVNFLISFAKQ